MPSVFSRKTTKSTSFAKRSLSGTRRLDSAFTGRSTIKTVSDPLLDSVAEVLKEHPEILKLEVQGHTDSQGAKALNQKLSKDRAESVKKAMEGIDIVIHLASIAGVDTVLRMPSQTMRISLLGTANVLAHELERFLTTLGTIAAMAPLLGLLGTVVGMIEIFGSQGPSGNNPAQLAHGISVALYNTAFGLIIAMLVNIFLQSTALDWALSVIGVLICPWLILKSAGNYIFIWLVGYGVLLGPIGAIAAPTCDAPRTPDAPSCRSSSRRTTSHGSTARGSPARRRPLATWEALDVAGRRTAFSTLVAGVRVRDKAVVAVTALAVATKDSA